MSDTTTPTADTTSDVQDPNSFTGSGLLGDLGQFGSYVLGKLGIGTGTYFDPIPGAPGTAPGTAGGGSTVDASNFLSNLQGYEEGLAPEPTWLKYTKWTALGVGALLVVGVVGYTVRAFRR